MGNYLALRYGLVGWNIYEPIGTSDGRLHMRIDMLFKQTSPFRTYYLELILEFLPSTHSPVTFTLRDEEDGLRFIGLEVYAARMRHGLSEEDWDQSWNWDSALAMDCFEDYVIEDGLAHWWVDDPQAFILAALEREEAGSTDGSDCDSDWDSDWNSGFDVVDDRSDDDFEDALCEPPTPAEPTRISGLSLDAAADEDEDDGGDIVLYERIPRVKLPPPRLPVSGGDGASVPDAEGVGAKKKKRRSHRGGKRGWQMWVARMKRRMAIEDAAAAAGMAAMSA